MSLKRFISGLSNKNTNLIEGHERIASSIDATFGDNSPNIRYVNGNVYITYTDIPEGALKHLNELLNLKNLQLEDKIKEAEEWASRYRELYARLSESNGQDERRQQAKLFLEQGQLDEARAILDQLIEHGEHQIERLAADYYNRGLLHDLEFKPTLSVRDYAKAYQYRPENPAYAFYYAITLHKLNQYKDAEAPYRAVLIHCRQLSEINPSAYLPNVATSLNNLGLLYYDT